MMISDVDILSLILGVAYSLLAPVLAYWIGWRWVGVKLRDVVLGVLAAPVAFGFYIIASWPLANAMVDGVLSDSAGALCLLAIVALLNGILCFLALRYAAASLIGWVSPVGFAIGFGGFQGVLIFGVPQYRDLKLALQINEGSIGLASATHGAVERFIDHAFRYGIPHGAASIAQLLIEVGLAMLIWIGVRRRDWKWVAGAILIDFAIRLAASLVGGSQSAVSIDDFYLVLGLAIVLAYRPVFALIGGRIGALEAPARSKLRPAVSEGGLLSTWRNQRSGDGS
jgi:YhfC intramembrane metalloprotease